MKRTTLLTIALGVALAPGSLMMRGAGVARGDEATGNVMNETAEQRNQRMQWWRDAKFGMFIHWGLYSIPAGEWQGRKVPGIGEWIMNNGHIPVADYEKLAGQFNPTQFNAREFARIAKNAGQKYIVITSKHHDGFCLWDSKVSSYTVAHTPFRRDILRELSDACKEEGIRFCLYHSIMDWHHPDAQAPNYPDYNTPRKKNPNFPRYVETYLKPQLKELITGYGPLGVLWFDGEWVPEYTEEMGRDIYAYCRSLQPDLIVNNRVGKSRAGMQGMSKNQHSAGDFGTPEQEIPATGQPGLDWESCMTMNDTWGFKKDDHHWKSDEVLLRNLIDIVSKGGNFLLNVGPTSEGLIPQPSVERLAAIGKWTGANGEAIYGAGPSPFTKLKWGRCTTKPGKLFLHVFNWPENGELELPGLHSRVSKAYLLAVPERPLTVNHRDDAITLAVPAQAADPIATVVVLEIEGKPDVQNPSGK
jgi:alpha-L-fucosidase